MYCTDFEYAGKRLSDFGMMLCHIADSVGTEAKNIGSQITFNTSYKSSLNKFQLISSQYDEAYTTTLQICKNVCNIKSNEEFIYTEVEIRNVMRWLNRKTYNKFKAIYEDGQYSQTWYNASFNIQAIKLGDDVIGFELTMNTDAPFGYYEQTEYTFNIEESDQEFTIYDFSDEVGYAYPDLVKIECLDDCDIEITSSKDEESVRINNCVKGEIIELIGKNKIITTNMDSHKKLYNDFNYNFLKIHNDYEDGENVYNVSHPCNITIVYSPICKGGVI